MNYNTPIYPEELRLYTEFDTYNEFLLYYQRYRPRTLFRTDSYLITNGDPYRTTPPFIGVFDIDKFKIQYVTWNTHVSDHSNYPPNYKGIKIPDNLLRCPTWWRADTRYPRGYTIHQLMSVTPSGHAETDITNVFTSKHRAIAFGRASIPYLNSIHKSS